MQTTPKCEYLLVAYARLATLATLAKFWSVAIIGLLVVGHSFTWIIVITGLLLFSQLFGLPLNGLLFGQALSDLPRKLLVAFLATRPRVNIVKLGFVRHQSGVTEGAAKVLYAPILVERQDHLALDS